MTDRRLKRLELLCRLREMTVEQARAEHVAAQVELLERRARADATQRQLEALDEWTAARITQGLPLAPELLRQAQLYRGTEKHALDEQRAEESKQGDVAESARGELTARFEELSVAERLAARHSRAVTDEELRRGFLELDEAGLRKQHEAKE
jgi:hypothetical protein